MQLISVQYAFPRMIDGAVEYWMILCDTICVVVVVVVLLVVVYCPSMVE